MYGRDIHQSLKSSIEARGQSRHANILLAKLQWGKEDIAYGLHIAPNTFSTAGIQVTDFLSRLGFERGACAFVEGQECFSRWVDAGFDVQNFATFFDQAYGNLVESQRDLGKCGFSFDQPEGRGYFMGHHSGGRRQDSGMSGDGHTAASVKLMKQSEDADFGYKFTWLEANEKGWVIHYRPKHLPMSSALQSALGFLGIQSFDQCPEHDFEPCRWHSIAHDSRGDDFFEGNANEAHGYFDAHATHFSSGIQKLLAANADIEKAGLSLLQAAESEEPLRKISLG